MIKFARIEHKPHVFQSLTGLSLAAFNQFLPAFAQAYEAAQMAADAQRQTSRQRRRGGGRKATLGTMADKLLFILFYFKLYPIQEAQGFFFGLSQGQACAWIHRLTPALNQALGCEKQLPARKPADVTQVLAACPGLEFIVDGSERPIQRPKDPARQRQYYSGKKKRHTVKNIVITDKRTKKIKALGRTHEGKKHDKAAVAEENYQFPPGSRLWKDTGFQGYEPAAITTYQPKKKPRGGALTPDEKQANTAISRERIGIEHSLGGVKVFHIVRDSLRSHRPAFEDMVMEVACGLHNLRLDFPLRTA
jgi:hypothetical protein